MLRKLLALVIVPLVLAGCGKTTEERAKETAGDINSKITRLAELNKTVAYGYDVVIMAGPSVSESDVRNINSTSMTKLSSARLQELRTLVTEMQQTAIEILALDDASTDVYLSNRYIIEQGMNRSTLVLEQIRLEIVTKAVDVSPGSAETEKPSDESAALAEAI